MGCVHCSTMCGAFVLTCSDTKKQNTGYQLGRLFSYTLLTFIVFLFSSIINFQSFNKELALFASISLGIAFIYLGFQGLSGIKLKMKFPAFLQTKINKLWVIFIKKKEKNARVSFAIGSLSILLPCGLLYSLVIPLAAIDSLLWSCIAIFSFWLGTLPAMGVAPLLIKQMLLPLKQKMPVFLSCFFILFGILMISVRVHTIYTSPSSEILLEICH
jgi:sulfite exporter TauE/SafE